MFLQNEIMEVFQMTDDEKTDKQGNELTNARVESGSTGRDDDARNSQQRSGRPRGQKIPSVDDLLGQLLQLNGAVVMGAMATKEASLINRNIKAVLDVQLKRINRDDGPVEQEALVERCRRDPTLLSIVSSFLSPQQVEELMREVMDEDHDEAA